MLVPHWTRVRCFYNPPRSASTRCSVAPPSRLYSDAILSSALCVVIYAYISTLEPIQKERKKDFERWSNNVDLFMKLTFVSRQRSIAAARVECLLFPRHVPLCGIPAPWRKTIVLAIVLAIVDGACAALGRNADIMYETVGGEGREMCVGMCVPCIRARCQARSLCPSGCGL